jgi:outer membrane protein assembly factor BamB
MMRVARVFLVAAFFSVSLAAQNWPQFRGPGGQGHADARDVPVEWSESRNVAWKTRVPGLGWSSPVISGNRVWLTTSTGERDVSLRAVAYDTASGSEVVNVEVLRVRNPRDINPKNSWASPTPVIDGDHVYVHFGADGTAALTADGKIVWTAKFPYQSQHGAGGSPIVHGDLLILSGDGPDTAFVVALDKRTGKVKWKTNRRYPHDQAYTTPLVIRAGDREQVVSVGAYRVGAYDPLTGKEIWRASYADGFSNVPRPVFGHGLVYVATGFQQPTLIAIRPDGTGDVTKTHLAWELRRGAPFTPSPILVGDELFVINDGGILTCVDAKSGTVIWQQRLNGTFSASPIYAGGRIYFSSEQGVTTVLVPGREFRRAAINTLDGAILASIAVAGNAFFIRTDTHLYKIRAADGGS